MVSGGNGNVARDPETDSVEAGSRTIHVPNSISKNRDIVFSVAVVISRNGYISRGPELGRGDDSIQAAIDVPNSVRGTENGKVILVVAVEIGRCNDVAGLPELYR